MVHPAGELTFTAGTITASVAVTSPASAASTGNALWTKTYNASLFTGR